MSSDEKSNSITLQCRICHEDDRAEELVEPCECSGTSGLIHASCLEKWLSTSNTDRCEICKYKFTIERKKKPMSQWWCSRGARGPRGIAGDVVCLIILTPFCLVATYLCARGASSYASQGYWQATGLSVLCFLLVTSYCVWLIVTIRFHCKVWRHWRRTHQDVKLLVKTKGGSGQTEGGNLKNAPNSSASDQPPRSIYYKLSLAVADNHYFYPGISRQQEAFSFA